MLRLLLATTLGFAFALPAAAEGFETIRDRDGFVDLVKDRDLRRFGIRLKVLDGGEITGSAFGKEVTGRWRWENGYFCRDLYLDGDDLGPNCQTVEVRGNTVRFIADRGEGIYADLRLE